MLTRLWTIGMKVASLDRELQFHRQLGNEIVLDEHIKTDSGEFRLPLVKMGDRFLHLMEETVYEQELSEPLALGPAHLVYVSDSWDEDVANAWSKVESAYQRRADLIPNLVETVQGYAKHEKEL